MHVGVVIGGACLVTCCHVCARGMCHSAVNTERIAFQARDKVRAGCRYYQMKRKLTITTLILMENASPLSNSGGLHKEQLYVVRLPW